jgi:hypothetical protein
MQVWQRMRVNAPLAYESAGVRPPLAAFEKSLKVRPRGNIFMGLCAQCGLMLSNAGVKTAYAGFGYLIGF